MTALPTPFNPHAELGVHGWRWHGAADCPSLREHHPLHQPRLPPVQQRLLPPGRPSRRRPRAVCHQPSRPPGRTALTELRHGVLEAGRMHTDANGLRSRPPNSSNLCRQLTAAAHCSFSMCARIPSSRIQAARMYQYHEFELNTVYCILPRANETEGPLVSFCVWGCFCTFECKLKKEKGRGRGRQQAHTSTPS